MRKGFISILFIIVSTSSFSQGTFSGDLQLNANFFHRDSLRNAINTPLYDNQLAGGESWLNMNYATENGWQLGARLELFHNSNLRDPNGSYSAQGIGMWYVAKQMEKLKITGGYFYDQFGSGITFRAYEQRGLAIDNAIYGIKLDYKLTENVEMTAFSGKQKNRFTTYEPVIKGAKVEYFKSVSDDLQLIPGATFINRTLDDNSMSIVVAELNSYADPNDRFIPKYNVYAYSVYNTLNYKNVSWFAEAAAKSQEAIVGRNGTLIDVPGTVFYTTLNYARKGIGITLQGKRTENFSFRTSPTENLLNGMITFLPSMTRQNTFRLLSRYGAATQDLGEFAYQADIVWTPKKGYTITANFSDIKDLDTTQLYREVYLDFMYKKNKRWNNLMGVQYFEYNQEIFEVKPGVPMIKSLAVFTEFSYKISRKKSLRFELQYQSSKQDLGSFAYILAEFNIAPKWSFSAWDMYNVAPVKAGVPKLHYPAFLAAYSAGQSRFTLAYIKQVEGIVCAGGVCRYEPAFSGVRFTLASTFN